MWVSHILHVQQLQGLTFPQSTKKFVNSYISENHNNWCEAEVSGKYMSSYLDDGK